MFFAVWKSLSDFVDNPRYKLVPDGLYNILVNDVEQDLVSDIKHINTRDFMVFTDSTNGKR
ncbi:hypothetical protein J2Z66_007905 [Paenibacillus eucommiae]|uniref:Uncharacterized protein n=1 Tax=Paenibacillus eucommiae TaxID=1355755 RepID=A0ABS4J8U1_9BACL|nr:hypothetical protein [Paenibacillus eucommiae]